MSPEKTKLLVEAYPRVFAKKLTWGFECGDGWFRLLDILCNAIEITLEYNERDIKRWTKDCQWKKPKRIKFEIVQVKEKFGGLRFYYNGGTEEIGGMVRYAEHLSEVTCENCGQPGNRENDGWIVTLCFDCLSARRSERQAKSSASVSAQK